MRASYVDGHGNNWHMDKERLKGVIRQYAYVSACLRNTKIVRTKDHFLQRAGLFNAHAEVEMPTKLIESQKQAIVARKMQELEALYTGDWFDVYAFLLDLRTQGLRLNQGLQSIFASAQQINHANTQAAQRMIDRSKFVRDVSITAVSVIGAAGTGGLTVALATGASAGLSTVGTYQDTGSVTKALTSGTLALVPLGSGKVAKTMTKAGNSPLIVFGVSALIDFGADTASELIISEEKIGKAMQVASVKLGVSLGLDGVGSTVSGAISKKLRNAMQITDGIDASNRLPSLLIEGGKKVAEKALPNGKENQISTAKKTLSAPPSDPIALKAFTYINEQVMRPAGVATMPGNGQAFV